jgi:hypothetical protein
MREYLNLYWELIDTPEFRAFMRTQAHLTYTVILMEHVFRRDRKLPHLDDSHPLAMYYDLGWLCAAPDLDQLQERLLGERSPNQIQADIERLSTLDLLEIYPTSIGGNQIQVLKLGEWQMHVQARRGRLYYGEWFFSDRIFEGNEESRAWPMPGS